MENSIPGVGLTTVTKRRVAGMFTLSHPISLHFTRHRRKTEIQTRRVTKI
jgi:hypothetical protein